MADSTDNPTNTQSIDEVAAMYKAKGVGQPLGFGRRVAVLVIDFQQVYTRTWRAKSLEPVELTAKLIEAARAQRLPVYYTYQGYDPEHVDGGIFGMKAPTLLEFLRGSWACEIDPLITPKSDDLVMEKTVPSAFFKSELADRLASLDIDTVVICGCSLSGCVRASVVDGMSYGYRMIVPEACVSDASEPSLRTSLMEINTKYGDVVTFEQALAGIKASEQVLA